MANCPSKELAHAELQAGNSDTIEIIKKVYETLLLVKDSLVSVVYSDRDQWDEEKLERTFDDFNKLCEK